jgi:hypothetical protein
MRTGMHTAIGWVCLPCAGLVACNSGALLGSTPAEGGLTTNDGGRAASGRDGAPDDESKAPGDSGVVLLDAADAGGSSEAGCGNTCTDFPSAPLNDPAASVPGDPTTLFPGDAGTGSTSGGPCMSEPADGALYPYNWLRPRVYWTSPATQTVFEVRFSAPSEINDYVVYTTNNYWALDEATWQKIAGVEGGAKGTLVGATISVTVRGTSASAGTPAIGNTAHIQIAPAPADGAVIYVTPSPGGETLKGFLAGDEGTTNVLSGGQVTEQVWAGSPDGGAFPQPPTVEPVGCIGCHTSTPDGLYVGFTAQWPWPNALASIQEASAGAAPAWLAAGAIANLSPNANDVNDLGGASITATNNVDNVMLGIQTFSKAHYVANDRIEITSVGSSMDDMSSSNGATVTAPQPACQGGTGPCVVSQLAWINLEWNGAADAGDRPNAASGAGSNGGWGILARAGDPNSAATPDWSHDGTTIAYTSVIQGTMDGRLYLPTSGSADIKTIPYGGGGGGFAAPLPGASSSTMNEYFPAFSPDDKLIAFNAVPAADTMYDQPAAEMFVVPYGSGCGGVPVRLAANDPVACTGLTSPGVQNTWPKWAPAAETIDGNTYYWVAFFSSRSVAAGASPGAPGKLQLYVAGVVVDSLGAVSTFAPIYAWNQDDTTDNTLPAWGEFLIPPGVTLPPPPPQIAP